MLSVNDNLIKGTVRWSERSDFVGLCRQYEWAIVWAINSHIKEDTLKFIALPLQYIEISRISTYPKNYFNLVWPSLFMKNINNSYSSYIFLHVLLSLSEQSDFNLIYWVEFVSQNGQLGQHNTGLQILDCSNWVCPPGHRLCSYHQDRNINCNYVPWWYGLPIPRSLCRFLMQQSSS